MLAVGLAAGEAALRPAAAPAAAPEAAEDADLGGSGAGITGTPCGGVASGAARIAAI